MITSYVQLFRCNSHKGDKETKQPQNECAAWLQLKVPDLALLSKSPVSAVREPKGYQASGPSIPHMIEDSVHEEVYCDSILFSQIVV